MEMTYRAVWYRNNGEWQAHSEIFVRLLEWIETLPKGEGRIEVHSEVDGALVYIPLK